MKLRILAIATAVTALLGSCAGNKQAENQQEPEKSKTLVLYYSQTGTTKAVAEEIQKLIHADIDSIVAQQSYGYDYDATIERWRKEKEDSVKVEILPLHANINDYDTIFLGFPIWGGTYASPVATFLADNSLEGKTVITFATFGSGGIEPATADVAAAQPKANVIEGYGVRNARIEKAPAEINRYLVEQKYLKGEIAPLPEYGANEPVSEADKEIFDKACSNYRFPLGTPVAVAKRSYDNMSDYRFEVKSTGPDGKESNSVVYVTVAPDGNAEFTRVVR